MKHFLKVSHLRKWYSKGIDVGALLSIVCAEVGAVFEMK